MDNKDLEIKYNTNPTKDNINYALQRLITPLAIGSKYEEYKDSWDDFNYILDKVINWAIIYDETKDLNNIDKNEVNKIENILYNLDGKYLSTDGLYAEETYEWILQLRIIINNNENMKGEK